MRLLWRANFMRGEEDASSTLFRRIMTLEGRKLRRATCSQQSNPLLRMADSRVE